MRDRITLALSKLDKFLLECEYFTGCEREEIMELVSIHIGGRNKWER